MNSSNEGITSLNSCCWDTYTWIHKCQPRESTKWFILWVPVMSDPHDVNPLVSKWNAFLKRVCNISDAVLFHHPHGCILHGEHFRSGALCLFWGHFSLIFVFLPWVNMVRSQMSSCVLRREIQDCTGCFILKIDQIFYAIPESDFLPDSWCGFHQKEIRRTSWTLVKKKLPSAWWNRIVQHGRDQVWNSGACYWRALWNMRLPLRWGIFPRGVQSLLNQIPKITQIFQNAFLLLFNVIIAQLLMSVRLSLKTKHKNPKLFFSSL